jgi:peroxisomal 3,2-trans-enoyl-CoA isomerase
MSVRCSKTLIISFSDMKSLVSLFRVPLLNKGFCRYASSESGSSVDFEKAKSRLESSSVEVDNETKLKLYGLYKQSTTGVCSISKPGLTDFVGRAKWSAWSSLGKMTQQDAQKEYIQTVQQLISSSTENDSSSKKNETKSAPVESNNEHIELIKKSAQHWEIVLNRPEKYNAITRPMYERLISIMDQAAEDKELTLISITGKGKFYSSGTDLADFATMAVRQI